MLAGTPPTGKTPGGYPDGGKSGGYGYGQDGRVGGMEPGEAGASTAIYNINSSFGGDNASVPSSGIGAATVTPKSKAI